MYPQWAFLQVAKSMYLLDSTCNEYLTNILYSCVPSPAEVMQGGTTCRNKEDLHHISYSQELKKNLLFIGLD